MAFKLTEDQAKEVAEYAQGTCKDEMEIASAFDFLSDSIPDITVDAITDAVNKACADNEVERCDTCSWWVEASEVDRDGNCEDCAEAAEEIEEDDGGE